MRHGGICLWLPIETATEWCFQTCWLGTHLGITPERHSLIALIISASRAASVVLRLTWQPGMIASNALNSRPATSSRWENSRFKAHFAKADHSLKGEFRACSPCMAISNSPIQQRKSGCDHLIFPGKQLMGSYMVWHVMNTWQRSYDSCDQTSDLAKADLRHRAASWEIGLKAAARCDLLKSPL